MSYYEGLPAFSRRLGTSSSRSRRRLRLGDDAALKEEVGRLAEWRYRRRAANGLEVARYPKAARSGRASESEGALFGGAIGRGPLVAVAVELPLVEGNVKARRLAFLVSPQEPLKARSFGGRRVPLRIMEGPTR